MAYLTSLGWLIALPIGLGTLAGWWIDRRLGSGYFWTMALLGAGIAVAALQTYVTLRLVSKRRRDG